MSDTTQKTSRAAEFRQLIGQRAVIADGAMGTMLYTRGVFINRCFDELNLSAGQMVREIHQEYVRAGAEVLETNTFGATRARLATFGIADKVEAINRAGVRLAREAAAERSDVFVAGAIGPLGVHLEPLGPTSYAEAREMFREQIAVFLDEGVDLLIFETFSQLSELREGLAAARDLAGPEMVIVAQVTIDDDGNMPDGTTTETFTQFLDSSPADVVGLNCSVGPKATLETLERMMTFTGKPVSGMPNAGHPTQVEGRAIYLSSPEYLAQYARRMLWAGVKMVGGCCGTTPEHIKSIKSEARSLQPGIHKLSVTVEEPKAKAKSMEKVPVAQKSSLGAKLAAGKFVAFVEILPPRGVDPAKEVAGARLCKDAGIDVINVPDGPRASARMSAQVTCQLIERDAGIESVLHFCCRDRNILGIQSELLGAHAAGIRNLICITGDPPRMGSYPEATAVFDVDSIGLANIVNNLNHGLDIGGNPIGSQTALLLGVGANPGALNIEEEIRRTEWKVQAGAEYIVTQPVFDIRQVERFLRKIEGFRIPVITGIWPLTSFRNAEFMVNELRVPVPDEYMDRMRGVEDPERARAEGVKIAQEMVANVRPMVDGVQLSAPFGRYAMAVEVAQAIGSR
ncbi:bifunctional homocysteine S-methyltransferase/methylenetetrahydrofolate reductase [Paludibaculum fermentans]|uniref:Bifunctional homocysteine S-methyltransferase/methylenetetrahydrofolate reductase n=1 Tax=Paludibaculum fermentans TaxID=1473598 RepID=A0A7S7NTN5_PALFE|nr:bifunctional homocysteine S-methyltransferase/methylenetetrahydrofolate reductase [Paludibaculum fermentans]QOY89550.1 bifunctional homocysteine S-methyltransferase/methylenetetrahydrofolate reductase [Paludibaculum fermentans]